jgi:hypothetical protein
LIPIAEALGYKVGLAALTYFEENHHNRIGCETNTTYKVSHWVNQDGTEMFKGSKRETVELDFFWVLPEDHFEDGPNSYDRDGSEFSDDDDEVGRC